MKKIKLTKLELNKSLIIDEKAKTKITSAERGRYSYFDYDKEIIQSIALKKITDVKVDDAHRIAQVLFPSYLICSGLFDSFLMFEIEDGKRKDPPQYWYSHFGSYLNNDNDACCNRLIDEVLDLFKVNNIEFDKSWEEYSVIASKKNNRE